ncbi:hypothetical protein CK203_006450 [Vitis vinifera]|uniref:Uncharacterized protein n=1 Tax=Vitis vinifera TaxID=29760 RepID=A0A438KAP2_VITVI|nr:hypothetical protein CK203_006450 [Vitis vinifera]
MAPKKTVSSARVSEAGEKAIDKLDVKEFRERFCIPNDVSIDLVNEEAAMPTEKGEENVILFTKEQFNAGLRFPLPALFKEFLHFSQFHPSSFIPTLSGKQKMISSVCPRTCPPFNGDRAARFDKGRGEGAGGGPGWMGGAIGACVEALFSKLYLKNSGSGIEGPPCGLGGKGVLRLCLQIIRDRSQGEGLQDIAFRAEFDSGRPGVPGICYQYSPQETAKDEIVPGEHYTVKELPLYQEAKEADAERRRKLLEDRDQRKNEGTIRKAPGQKRGPDSPPKKTPAKRRKLVKKHGKDVKEPTPPKEFPPPQITYEGEVMIEEPVNAAPHSISSGPGRMSGLNHSGTSLAAVARLANVAEEAASINRPGNLNPDADAAETTPLEEAGAESQSQPSDDPDRLAIVPVKGPPSKKPRSTRDLRSGLLGRLQERQQEIEVSCASAHDAHPDGGEVEMATETSPPR